MECIIIKTNPIASCTKEFTEKIKLLVDISNEISAEDQRQIVRNRIRDSVLLFKIILRKGSISNHDMRLTVQRMLDVLAYTVVSTRYGVDSLEMERLLDQRWERQWLELGDEV